MHVIAKRRLWLLAAALPAVGGFGSRAHAAGVCNDALNIDVSQSAFLATGDRATITINIGSGTITGGTANTITISRLRYELDCNANVALGVPCADQGDIMSYAGDSSIVSSGTTCGSLSWTSNLAAGGTVPNEIVFTPSKPIVFPTNTPADGAACALAFTVKLDDTEPTSGANSDGTPTEVEVVAGFSTTNHDTACDNGGQSGVSQSGFVSTCPTCTGDHCNTSACNTTTGECVLAPIVCNDNSACTTDTCDPATGCVFTPITCNDNNPCTSDTCDPSLGCVHTTICSSTTTSSTTTSLTTTTTLVMGLDHFQCYELKPSATPPFSVTIQDAFGTLTGSPRFPHRLCAPADKNGEDPTAPTHLAHLTGYVLTNVSGFTRQLNQTIVNQFGSVTLDALRPAVLMVPTAKSLTGPPAPLTPPTVDHFQCYKVKRSRGAAKFVTRTVDVVDQFEHVSSFTVQRPYLLCAPADKNGEDPTAPGHLDYLLCYKTHSGAFKLVVASIDNQFESDQVTVIHRREFCVPSRKNPAPATTTTITTTSTTTTTAV